MVSRTLLAEQGELSLRAVAREMGMTAPALYRYVSSHQELVYLVADSIGTDVAVRLAAARARHPADDPAAQILAAAAAFRSWALSSRDEFSLVFANPVTADSLQERDEISGSAIGELFKDLLEAVYERYGFAIPGVDELDPDVLYALREPFSAAIPCTFPEEVLGLGWIFMRAWAGLYGTVTLEVFGHLDPNIIASGAMFRAMLEDQAQTLGFAGELDRLRPVVNAEMIIAEQDA